MALNYSSFLSTDDVNLDSLKIKSSLLLWNAKFIGHANFIHSTVERDLHAEDAVFEGDVWLNSLIVDKDAVFKNARFNGDVQFQDADLHGNLKLNDAAFAKRLSLSRTSIGKELHLFSNRPCALYDFGSMHYYSVTASNENLDGSDGGDSHHAVLDCFAASRSAPESLRRLADYYRASGYPAEEFRANWRFIKIQAFDFTSSFVWAWILLGLMFLYGWWTFDEAGMRSLHDPPTVPHSPGWYVVDLLLPVGGLHAADEWIPVDEPRARARRKRHRVLTMRFIKTFGRAIVGFTVYMLAKLFWN